eukprot:jgi/Mesvir1/29183/Mv19459-RA.1
MDMSEEANEVKALKANLRSNQKVIAEMQAELTRTKAALEDKEDKIAALTEAKKQAMAAAASAEQLVRSTGSKMATAPSHVSAVQQLESELREKKAEIAKLKEDKEATERLLKARDVALTASVKKLEGAKSTQNTVSELENKFHDLRKQNNQLQEENRTLTKMLRTKTQTIEKLQSRADAAEEAVTESDQNNKIRAMAKAMKELEDEKKTLERELARTSAVAARAAALGDEEDGMIPVKQWLEERRFLQGQVKRLQEKITNLERSSKGETAVKEKLRQRLEVLEQSLKSTQGASQRRMNGAAPLLSPAPATAVSGEDGEAGGENGSVAAGEDVVSGAMFEALQKEVLILRNQVADYSFSLAEKDDTIEMLTRKSDLLAQSKEIDLKKMKRDNGQLIKELSTLRIDMVTKEDEYKEREDALKKEVFKIKQKLNALQLSSTTH